MAGQPAHQRRGNPLAVVAVLLAAMAFYFGLIGYRGLYLLGQDRWLLKVLGVAVLVLPVIGCWVVVAELRFGLASQRLERRMREAGSRPTCRCCPGCPRAGWIARAADGWFDQQRQAVEQAPQDWRSWFRLAQAYDLAGDRKRAREALRTAIERSR